MDDLKLFVDSSVWLAYFLKENEYTKLIIEGDKLLLTSVISIFEIKKKLTIEKFDENRIKEVLAFIKSRSFIIDLDMEICELASDFSVKFKLHATDSLIYTTARKFNVKLLTLDPDFQNVEFVHLLN